MSSLLRAWRGSHASRVAGLLPNVRRPLTCAWASSMFSWPPSCSSAARLVRFQSSGLQHPVVAAQSCIEPVAVKASLEAIDALLASLPAVAGCSPDAGLATLGSALRQLQLLPGDGPMRLQVHARLLTVLDELWAGAKVLYGDRLPTAGGDSKYFDPEQQRPLASSIAGMRSLLLHNLVLETLGMRPSASLTATTTTTAVDSPSPPPLSALPVVDIASWHRCMRILSMRSLGDTMSAFHCGLLLHGLTPSAASIALITHACLRYRRPELAFPFVASATLRGMKVSGSLAEMLIATAEATMSVRYPSRTHAQRQRSLKALMNDPEPPSSAAEALVRHLMGVQFAAMTRLTAVLQGRVHEASAAAASSSSSRTHSAGATGSVSASPLELTAQALKAALPVDATWLPVPGAGYRTLRVKSSAVAGLDDLPLPLPPKPSSHSQPAHTRTQEGGLVEEEASSGAIEVSEEESGEVVAARPRRHSYRNPMPLRGLGPRRGRHFPAHKSTALPRYLSRSRTRRAESAARTKARFPFDRLSEEEEGFVDDTSSGDELEFGDDDEFELDGRGRGVRVRDRDHHSDDGELSSSGSDGEGEGEDVELSPEDEAAIARLDAEAQQVRHVFASALADAVGSTAPLLPKLHLTSEVLQLAQDPSHPASGRGSEGEGGANNNATSVGGGTPTRAARARRARKAGDGEAPPPLPSWVLHLLAMEDARRVFLDKIIEGDVKTAEEQLEAATTGGRLGESSVGARTPTQEAFIAKYRARLQHTARHSAIALDTCYDAIFDAGVDASGEASIAPRHTLVSDYTAARRRWLSIAGAQPHQSASHTLHIAPPAPSQDAAGVEEGAETGVQPVCVEASSRPVADSSSAHTATPVVPAIHLHPRYVNVLAPAPKAVGSIRDVDLDALMSTLLRTSILRRVLQ